jgi:hypothetical protein
LDCFFYLFHKDLLGSDMEKYYFRVAARASQMAQTDYDKQKILMINYEFFMNFLIDWVSLCHFLLMIFLKGFSFSFISHLLVFRMAYLSYSKMFKDFKNFFKFRDFMKNLENDFPLVRFEVGGGTE